MKASFLADTDVSSAYLRGVDPGVRDRWQATPAVRIAVCSVVRAELEAGAWGTNDPHNTLAKLDRLLGNHESLPFDDRAASEYGRIASDLRRAGRDIGTADMMIAAIALANGLTVVTRNTRHFSRVRGLKVTRW